MDFARFKAAFGKIDGSRIFEKVLDGVQRDIAAAWKEVSDIQVEGKRALLGSQLREKEGKAGEAAIQGRSRPSDAVSALETLRGEVIQLAREAKGARSLVPLDPETADGEALAEEILDWRFAIDPDVEDALKIDLPLKVELVEAVKQFEEGYRQIGAEDRDHATGRSLVRKIENLTIQILVADRERRESEARSQLLLNELFDAINTIQNAVESKDYGDPPEGALAVALGDFDQALKDLQSAQEHGDPLTVEEALHELSDAIDAVDVAIREYLDAVPVELGPDTTYQDAVEGVEFEARKDYLAFWKPLMPKAQYISGILYVDVPERFRQPFQEINGARQAATRVPNVDYVRALAEARQLETLIVRIEQALDRVLEPPPAVLSDEARLSSAKKAWKELDRRVRAADAFLRPDMRRLLGDSATSYRNERDPAQRDWARAIRDPVDVDAAEGALTRLQTAVSDLERAVTTVGRQRLKDMETEGSSAKLILAEAERWAKMSPEVMRGLAPETLDKVAEEVGPKANSGNQREVMRAAVMARYDLEALDGDMSAKALPRLYKVMGQVPEEHVRTNEKLQRVIRKREITGSWYTEDDNEIVLNMPRGWMLGPGGKVLKIKAFFKGERFGQDDDVEEGFEVEQPEGKEYFDHTMLHEIGHAVDSQAGFMDGKVGVDAFGGWRTVSIHEVAEAIGQGKNLYADFPGVEARTLREYLVLTLGGERRPHEKLEAGVSAGVKGSDLTDKETLMGSKALARAEREAARLVEEGWAEELRETIVSDISGMLIGEGEPFYTVGGKVLERMLPRIQSKALSREAAIDQVLDTYSVRERHQPAGVDWAAISRHPAVKLCGKIRCKGDNGLWDKGKAAAQEATFGGRVYQQAYDSQWVSYTLAARSKGVSAYQFRAEGEWFAEAYALFYMDRLPPAHPLYDWLSEQTPPQD